MKTHGPARTYLTVNDALPDLARHVLDGDELGSRRGERVLERLHQQITLAEPWDRYSRIPLRKASLPAQIAETMWILSGRNDVEWLSYYLPRAAEFSDDGETWRGGYGPRIRRFGGEIDQIKHVVDVLRADLTSRRAVISIWDPMIDTVPGLDQPCNDFISFQSRLGQLHAHVFVRSNDLMWGWSGINAFEWSVLQETIASILGIEVGALTFSISSLHAYDRHWSKLRKIGEAYPEAEGGFDTLRAFDAPRMTTDPYRPKTVAELDDEIGEWFKAEARIREAASFDEAWTAANSAETSGLFTAFLQVIAAARFGRADELDSRILCESLKVSPQAPFAVVEEVETIRSGYGQPSRILRSKTTLSPALPEAGSALSRAATVEELSSEISSLHEAKHAAYGDSWKRRGETLGILANIARKVDRLGKTDEHETALDTAVDLLVYLAKYEAWLQDQADGGSRSDGTQEPNIRIREVLRQAQEDGPPYPAEFLAEDLNRSILSEKWGKGHPWASPQDKADVVEVMSRRAAWHVLRVWGESK